jgi:acyl-[acyl carrier protein]--UDP-N-acetylglucosamine O-acyltransferase
MNTIKYDFLDGHGPVDAHFHPNGGGVVANTALVGSKVYVDKNAKVFGNAEIIGFVNILDNAKIYGNAHLSGNVQVSDNAEIYGKAVLSGGIKVFNNAKVFGKVNLSGDFEIYEDVVLDGILPQNQRFGRKFHRPKVREIPIFEKRKIGTSSHGEKSSIILGGEEWTQTRDMYEEVQIGTKIDYWGKCHTCGLTPCKFIEEWRNVCFNCGKKDCESPYYPIKNCHFDAWTGN